MNLYFSPRRKDRKVWRMRIELKCKPAEIVGLCELCVFARPSVGSLQEKTIPPSRPVMLLKLLWNCHAASNLRHYGAMDIAILPSLLAADLGRLADECRRAAGSGADALHLDIMDAHFVPNLSFGPDVAALAHRTAPAFPLNVHLMMTHPQQYAGRFIDAGASTVLIHVEASCGIVETLASIRARGVRCGLTVKPGTPAEALFPFLREVDEVLVMTVEPGYGGQAFMPGMLPKLTAIRREADRVGREKLPVMVDGGINDETAAACAAHGANAFVAGNSLFRLADLAAGVRAMRAAAAAAYGRDLND